VPGPQIVSHFRGFRLQAEGAAAGRPEFGPLGSAHTILTRSGHSVAVFVLFQCLCAVMTVRDLALVTGGGWAAMTPSRGSLGALRRHAASAALSLLRAVR
jgi:hypothetical protein